jgi:hypothetical protein
MDLHRRLADVVERIDVTARLAVREQTVCRDAMRVVLRGSNCCALTATPRGETPALPETY